MTPTPPPLADRWLTAEESEALRAQVRAQVGRVKLTPIDSIERHLLPKASEDLAPIVMMSPETMAVLESGYMAGPLREWKGVWPATDWAALDVPAVDVPLTRLERAIVALAWAQPTWLTQRGKAAMRNALQVINPAWDTHAIGDAWRTVRDHQTAGRLGNWDPARPAQNPTLLIENLGAYHRPTIPTRANADGWPCRVDIDWLCSYCKGMDVLARELRNGSVEPSSDNLTTGCQSGKYRLV